MIATPNCIILADAEAVADAAAEQILHLVATANQEKRAFHFVLSGGKTPKQLYKILSKSNLSWDTVHFYWGDERSVGPDHSDSNYKMAYDALLSKINLPSAHIHRLQGEIAPELAACNYEKTIRSAFGLTPDDPAPSFDLVLLGMGTDGHTASLFPETEALKEKTKWVAANFVPKLAGARLTLTPVILNQTKNIFFLVAGSDKAKILKDVLEGPYHPDLLPAQLIRKETGGVTWFVDEAASGCLSSNRESL
jgi:6-phosphogluconolactonase